MSLTRALLLVALLSVLSAGVLALVSRTPAQLRLARPAPGATDPSLGADFSDEQVNRHSRYRAPAYLAAGLSVVVQVVALATLARGPFATMVRWSERVSGSWALRAVILSVLLAVLLFVADLPIAYVRGFAMERAWGLSTQDLGGWLSDWMRSTAVAAVTFAVAGLAFFATVRLLPRWWWLSAWAVFTALTAALAFLWPVLIAPLFNKFTPLQDARLERRIRTLAAGAGVEVERVLVADASRRTRAENAYVAGLGSTKRVVLYDTLLESSNEDEAAVVVAHELGHEAEDHVFKNVLIASAGLFAGFLLLAWLGDRKALWAWAGGSGIEDLRALPVLVLLVVLGGLVAAPLGNAVSRSFERRADATALSLTQNPDAFVASFRRLAFRNISDLRPPRLAVLALYTHPPVPERIETALEQAERRP